MGWISDLLFILQWASVFLVKVAFCLIAILIFWRRSDDYMTLFLSFMLVTFTLEGIGNTGFDASAGMLIILLGGLIFFVLPFYLPK